MSSAKPTHIRKYMIPDEAAMLAFGAYLAKELPASIKVIHLVGDLGAGKTTLVRGFLTALGYQGIVKSPTYSLVELYQLGERTIYHFDLYRLSDPEELEYIGIRDYMAPHHLSLLEWPDKGGLFTPQADLIVNIKHTHDGRLILLKGLSLYINSLSGFHEKILEK